MCVCVCVCSGSTCGLSLPSPPPRPLPGKAAIQRIPLFNLLIGRRLEGRLTSLISLSHTHTHTHTHTHAHTFHSIISHSGCEKKGQKKRRKTKRSNYQLHLITHNSTDTITALNPDLSALGKKREREGEQSEAPSPSLLSLIPLQHGVVVFFVAFFFFFEGIAAE